MDSGLVAALGLAISFIAWLTRLESKVANSSRDIERLERVQDGHEGRMSELDLRMMEKLSKIEQMVAKIEGKLNR